MTLDKLMRAATQAEQNFDRVLREEYPGANRQTYYQAEEKMREGTADEHEKKMAQNPKISSAHAAYITALHAYYEKRDSPKGSLGKRGL